MASEREFVMQFLERSYMFDSGSGTHWLYEDSIAVIIVDNQWVLVALTGDGWEFSHLI